MNVIGYHDHILDMKVESWILNKDQCFVERYTNGCGSKSNEKYVPDFILGLDLRIVCMIHDLTFYKVEYKLYHDIITTDEAKLMISKYNKDMRYNIEILAKKIFMKNDRWYTLCNVFRSNSRFKILKYIVHLLVAKIYQIGVDLGGFKTVLSNIKSNISDDKSYYDISC